MATAGSIVVDLLMRTGSFETDAQRASKTAQKAMKDLERQANAAATGVSNSFKGLLTGAVFGIGVSSVFSKFITETRNAQDEQAQLAAVLKSTGEVAGYTAKQLNEMATAFAGTSTFSEGDINKAQTRLLSYSGVVGEEFPRALQAAIDMSARLGTSVEQSAETVGKALDVPSKGLDALSKQGFRFSEDQKKLAERLEATGRTAEAQAIVLEAMESAYGGAAAAARDTLGGALDALGHQIDSLMTGDDGSVNGLTGAINDLTDSLGSEETKRTFVDFTAWLAETGKAVIGLANDFAAGMQAAGGFVDALLTFGTINPFNSPAENVEKYTAQLQEAVAWRDRLLAAGDTEGADTVAKKVQQIQNQLRFSQRQVNRNESDVFAAYKGYGETGRDIPTLETTIVRPSAGGGSKKGGKTEIDQGQKLIDQMNERIALIGKETEYEKLLVKISMGSVKFRTEGQKEEALGQAKIIDFFGETQKAYDESAIKSEEMPKAFAEATEQMTVFAEQAAKNIQTTMGDSIYGALTGQYQDMGDAFKDMLARMASDITASQINKLLLGQFGVGGSSQVGGLLGSLAGMMGFGPKFLPAGIGIGGAAGGALSGGTFGGSALGTFAGLFKGFDGGGYTGPGGKMEPAGIVHKGEYVFDANSTKRLGVGFLSRLRGYSDGGLVGGAPLPSGMSGGGNVSVHNYGGGQVETERMSDGELRVYIDRQIAQKTPLIMAGQQRDPNSRFSKAQSRATKTQRNRG